MKLLAIESSAKTASVAITEDGVLLGEMFQNRGLTHSKTILPMIDSLLSGIGMKMNEMEAIAVSNGPGSFTGLRIGVAAAKGLALARDIPCVGVSTLEAAAFGAQEGYVSVLMDARAGQVYHAGFLMKNGTLTRVSEDKAVPIEQIRDELFTYERVTLMGDGAHLCLEQFPEHQGLILPPLAMRVPRAYGVALAAQGKAFLSPEHLTVEYLRLPQAERERLKKLKGEQGK
ncbi:MAG: tRNA (adenosine(37)-N6)-threonylcarbamoyltransferase complex dimerization subunit type 1 TsaB [Ruminococcaceae bacterium]|nr:tRNA (adenosine(37)-N6)-threonylcarbamoyltransferase complex dimerization subunit type 1 TsaB [Oscillospiraceae bacterium]